MVDCGLCIRIDSCKAHKHMTEIAWLEELAEFCGEFAERSCAYCDHFTADNDLSDPEYNPDIDGHCGEGGPTEIGDSKLVRMPNDPHYCVAWRLANELVGGE